MTQWSLRKTSNTNSLTLNQPFKKKLIYPCDLSRDQTSSPIVGGHDSPLKRGHVFTHHPKKGHGLKHQDPNCVLPIPLSPLSPLQNLYRYSVTPSSTIFHLHQPATLPTNQPP